MAAPKKIKTDSVTSGFADITSGKVEVIGTGIDGILKEGKVYEVSALHANTLIKKGSATLKQE